MMQKPRIRKIDSRWTVIRPPYGFSSGSINDYDTWKDALASLYTAPATGSSGERGYHSKPNSWWMPPRGDIRL